MAKGEADKLQRDNASGTQSLCCLWSPVLPLEPSPHVPRGGSPPFGFLREVRNPKSGGKQNNETKQEDKQGR